MQYKVYFEIRCFEAFAKLSLNLIKFKSIEAKLALFSFDTATHPPNRESSITDKLGLNSIPFNSIETLLVYFQLIQAPSRPPTQ